MCASLFADPLRSAQPTAVQGTCASRSAAHSSSRSSLVEACESYSVNSRLLYNDIEQLSRRRFDYAQRLILWSRLLGVASLVAAGAAGLAVYFQQAQLYRVWRLRNPRRVQQLAYFSTLSGGFSLCSALFLISPVGLMRLHEKELQRTKQLDAAAVAALVQEQNFRTVAAWARSAAETGRWVPAPAVPTAASPPAADAAHHAGWKGGKAGDIEAEQQWVWKEVVLDPTQLQLLSPPDHSTSKRPATPAYTAKADPPSAGTAAAADADAAVRTAKKQLSARLLVPSEPFDSPSRQGVSNADFSAELPTCQQQPRRAWGRTADPVELQRLKDECVAMWEKLLAEKTAIAQRVW
ncbi:hypothetical protein LSCM1_07844 [Leishmania martiniquensis]|uniref:Transmembrane protein n=1 Tax=Leishmania martiniquensis TaxID=1580590 RepID=A0A836KR57_9TRYP|nr:hypothetical protein LSCM1_07844 [Leishmania martiniquensis]